MLTPGPSSKTYSSIPQSEILLNIHDMYALDKDKDLRALISTPRR